MKEDIIKDKEKKYLLNEYIKLDYQKRSVKNFMDEIFNTINNNIIISRKDSILDIGCGRGYFLKYLQEKDFKNIKGIDPCNLLIDNRLIDKVKYGSFENNHYNDNEFDIVITIHTLHHLKQKDPIIAINEMLRISKKYIVIVEINNYNIPMFLISMINKNVEQNAFRYNRNKVLNLLERFNCDILESKDMKSCYISNDTFFYKLLSKIGGTPYNITIAKKI